MGLDILLIARSLSSASVLLDQLPHAFLSIGLIFLRYFVPSRAFLPFARLALFVCYDCFEFVVSSTVSTGARTKEERS